MLSGKEGKIRILGFLLLIDFIVTMVILFTDKNLQNDFGIYHGSGYFLHWYGLLVTGILDIVGAIILFVKPQKLFLIFGTIWSVFMIGFTFGDIFLYSEVGLSNANQFATYLFGLSKYPGAESYYPGLYDVLVAIYIIAFVYALILLFKMKKE